MMIELVGYTYMKIYECKLNFYNMCVHSKFQPLGKSTILPTIKVRRRSISEF